MLQKKYLISVYMLMYFLFFSCLFTYSGLNGEEIKTQNTIIYLLFAFITLLSTIAIFLYVKQNKRWLLNKAVILIGICVLYSSFFVLMFCGENYTNAVGVYVVLNLPEVLSAILICCLYFTGLKKLEQIEVSVNKSKLVPFFVFSFIMFLYGCFGMYTVGFTENDTMTNLSFSFRCKYIFLIAIIMFAGSFWLEVKGKLNNYRTIFIFVLYLLFTVLIIFLPAIIVSGATAEIYDNNYLSAFIMSFCPYFYLFDQTFYSYELSGSILAFVITELLCFVFIYGAAAVFAYNNKIDSKDIESHAIESVSTKLSTESRLEIVENLVTYMKEGIISEDEFSKLKLNILDDENFVFSFNDDDFKNLRKLKDLYDKQILTFEEFERERKKIINL